MTILHDFAFFWRHTLTYHTSFSLIFWASHNSAGLVHGLHDFAWPYFMILHFWEVYPYISYIIFCMTIFHDFAWLFNCWDVHPFILLIKTAPVLLLCNWICGGQECLDDHPWHLFQYCMVFWASFVKQVSWESFILPIKTAPVLFLHNWICGGQECLDDHPRHLFKLYRLFWASFVKQVSW